ncbi:hypothetical protein XENORESO_012463 [Xenotaenia resolanae]|uniref:Uncharacterized protein n=1 Tax=Xenotaenia resolanae TaxID=208358 RepID=A0ABV0WHX2_9TELE
MGVFTCEEKHVVPDFLVCLEMIARYVAPSIFSIPAEEPPHSTVLPLPCFPMVCSDVSSTRGFWISSHQSTFLLMFECRLACRKPLTCHPMAFFLPLLVKFVDRPTK